MKNSNENMPFMERVFRLPVVGKNRYASAGMPSHNEVLLVTLIAILTGVIIAIVFVLNPELDRQIAHDFADEYKVFSLGKDPVVSTTRKILLYGVLIAYGVILYAWIKAFQTQKPVLGIPWYKWSYLGCSALIGSILLVNQFFKAYWGRVRPRDMNEFGGSGEYFHFWEYWGSCTSNCSFPSGEVAGITMLVFSIGFLLGRPARYGMFLLALVLGAFVAWLRMARGAHYATDTLFAIVLMIIVAAEVYYVFFLRPARWISWCDEKQQEKLAAKNKVSQS